MSVVKNLHVLGQTFGISHLNLDDIGTNSHAQIDTHIADATIHRSINDAGTGVTDLWSASKISSEVGSANPLTTKGDLIVHDGVNSVRLPVGSDGEFLSVNSGTTEGVEWVSSSLAPLASVQARRISTFTVTGVYSDIIFENTDVETDDTQLERDAVNQQRINALVDGTYLVSYTMTAENASARVILNNVQTAVNGSEQTVLLAGGDQGVLTATFLIDLVANDYLILQVLGTVNITDGITMMVSKLDGVQGATGATGAPGDFNWTGAWSSLTTYIINDVVENNGSSYVCILGNTNQMPPNITYWELVAEKGDTGASGDISWQGEWSSLTSYNINDTVQYLGSSYVAVANNTNSPPADNPGDWDLVAQKAEETLSCLQVRRTTTLALIATFVDITFDTTDFENAPLIIEHDNTNTERINFLADGTYSVEYCVSGGRRGAFQVELNGTTPLAESLSEVELAVDDYCQFQKKFIRTFTAGDYITLQGNSSGGGSIRIPAVLSVIKLDGVIGPAGPAGDIVWQGQWSALTSYTANDTVENNGSSYKCILAHTNQEPPNITYWDLVAAKGDTGASGDIVWQGEWSSLTSYNVNDTVQYLGSTYISLTSNTNKIPPDNPSDWDLVASAASVDIKALSIRRTTGYVATGTYTDISFDSTDFENDPLVLEHDNTNTERANILQDGTYAVTYTVIFGDADGFLRLFLNGTTQIDDSVTEANTPTTRYIPMTKRIIRDFTSGDYVTLQVQSSANPVIAPVTLTIEKLDGVKGDTGSAGAPGDISWQGSWSGATAYSVNDAVERGGSSYVCILGHTNQEPPNITYWDLLASKGDAGGVSVQKVESATVASTTSATAVLIPSMTITPASGTYYVSFSAYGYGDTANQLSTVQLFSGGVLVANTTRELNGDFQANTSTARQCIHTQTEITVNGAEAIEARYFTATGSFTIEDRSLFLIAV